MKISTCKACQGTNLDKFIQPVILSILSRKEGLNGFQVVKNMESYVTFRSGAPDPSGVYRYLKAMTEKGLLEQKADEEGRMIYFISDSGIHCLKNWQETISTYATDLEKLAEQIK